MDKRKKFCDGCDSEQYIWKSSGTNGNKYCQACWNKIKYEKEPPKIKQQTKINPKSKKQIILDKAYTLLRKDYLEKHPMCEIHAPGCHNVATDIHHTEGRGKNYLMVMTWKASCRKCHDYIHFVNPIWAKEMGYL